MSAFQRNGHERSSQLGLIWRGLKSTGSMITHRWALASFSLIAAFGVWFVIQDVENPRVDGWVPAITDPPAFPVDVKNAGNYIVAAPNPVKVRVEARKADFATLRATDFTASVDVNGKPPGIEVSVPVTVKSTRDGVRILQVDPPNVTVTLQTAKVKDMPVTARIIQRLPDNYQLAEPAPVIDPPTVKVRGLPELVDSVASVDLDVNLSGARSDSVTIEGDLVARTEGGNTVTVTLSQPRAKATYQIEETFVQRTLGITPSITGQPAAGYRVGNVTIDPPSVTISGPKAVVDSLQSISTEAVNITGARNDITQTRQVDKIPNLATDRTTVIVKVEIRPIDCGDPTAPSCATGTFVVAPTFTPATPGLVVDSQTAYTVTVHVTGPLLQLTTLKLSDIKVTVNLTNPVIGTKAYDVSVTVPTGFKADPDPPQLAVTLKPAPSP